MLSTMNGPLRLKDEWLLWISVLAVGCYDLYYKPLGRVFDYMAFIFVFLFVVLNRRTSLRSVIVLDCVKISLLAFAPFATGFIFASPNRGILGLCFAFLFTCTFCLAITAGARIRRIVLDAVAAGIIISFAVALAQGCFFWFAGKYIDITGLLGSISSRDYNPDINFFRPSGLFQEPNSFAVFLFLGATIILSVNEELTIFSGLAVMAGIAGLFISNSLWGWGAAFICVALYWRKIGIKRTAYTGLALLLTAVVWASPVTVSRILNVKSESSLQERYLGARVESHSSYLSIVKNSDQNFRSLLGALKVIVGNGISSEGYQFVRGANSFSYLYVNCGVLGIALYLLFWLRVAWRDGWQIFPVAVFLLSSYPYFTYMIFWIWVLMVSNINHRRDELSSMIRVAV